MASLNYDCSEITISTTISDDKDDPRQPLLSATTDEGPADSRPAPRRIQVYRQRWYVLLVFSLLAGTQGGVWNTFGPIAASAETAFHWTAGNIGILNSWGSSTFIVGTVPLIWLLEKKGLRAACLVTALLVAGGTIARVFTADRPAVTELMNVGQALNGLAGPIAMAGPPAVSAVWFPTEQRTTATAIGNLLGMLGTAASNVIGPLIVPDVVINATAANSSLDNGTWHWDELQRGDEQKAIMHLMYVECVWACLLLVAIALYFPSKPPLPPSLSSGHTVQREGVLRAALALFTSRKLMTMALAYGIPQGVLSSWASILVLILKPLGFSEKECGWLGFAASCGGCVMSLVVARLSDRLQRLMKVFIVFMYVVGTVCFLVFSLAVDGFISPTPALLWTTVIVGMSVLNAATPLMFEMSCEIAYPRGEGVAAGILALLNSIFGGIFLLLILDPRIIPWLNWILVGATAVCVPLLCFLKVEFKRLDMDVTASEVRVEAVVEPPAQV